MNYKLGSRNSLTISTPDGLSFQQTIATPYARGMAALIDLLMIIVCNFALSIGLGVLGALGSFFADAATSLMILGFFVTSVGYGMILEWLMGGQTLGKKVFRLRVIDQRGLMLTLPQVIIRNLLRPVDLLPVYYLFGALFCFFSKNCQRLGDFAAGTVVIREVRPSAPDLETLGVAGDNSFTRYPHIEARLRQRTTPEEAQLALDAIVRRDTLPPERRLELFHDMANHFRELATFPDEVQEALSDEQYVRNTVQTLYRKSQA